MRNPAENHYYDHTLTTEDDSRYDMFRPDPERQELASRAEVIVKPEYVPKHAGDTWFVKTDADAPVARYAYDDLRTTFDESYALPIEYQDGPDVRWARKQPGVADLSIKGN